MKIILESIAITVLVFGLMIGLVVGLCSWEAAIDADVWNGGFCPCGGEWKFSNASHLKNGGDLYYYHCEECGQVIDTHTPQIK